MNEYKTRKVSSSRRYNYGIMQEINSIGFDNFKVEIIDYAFSDSELSKLEKYYIVTSNSINPEIGYNSRTGDLKEPLNDATRKLMSKSHIGLVETSDTKRKKSKPIIAFKSDICYIAESGKLFAVHIETTKDMVSHAISKGMKIRGYYVFHLTDKKDCSDKYRNLKDPMYFKLYKLVKKGVETIEKSYKIHYINYD